MNDNNELLALIETLLAEHEIAFANKILADRSGVEGDIKYHQGFVDGITKAITESGKLFELSKITKEIRDA